MAITHDGDRAKRTRRTALILMGVIVVMLVVSVAVIFLRNDTLARMPVW